ELEGQRAQVEAKLAELEEERLFSGPYDSGDSVVFVHAGAGGVDSQDWAEMLLRMEMRWAEKRGFKVELAEVSPGEEAGIKSATFLARGDNAYGLFSAEKGVHRLVRISPFDAAARRHTSFALVEVSPLVDEVGDVEIDEGDLQIDTYRASGAGGQHVNKTDSAVRITHRPTGIVVQCQKEPGVVAGLRVAEAVFRRIDPELRWHTHVHEGEWREDGLVAEVAGHAGSILRGERVALNFLGRLSGVATLTARYVRAVEGTGARILDTRKTTPLMRELEKKAVLVGGGFNHRFGLDDAILIKENHSKMAGGEGRATE